MRRTKKCTRVADRAFPEVTVTWRQPGDFGRYLHGNLISSRLGGRCKIDATNDGDVVRLLTGAGVAAGAYIPFVYGTWLVVVPSDGTSKFGGILIITVGSTIGAITGGFIGLVLRKLCVSIPVASRSYRYSLVRYFVFFVAVTTIVTGVSLIARSARDSITRGYLITLADYVDRYENERGTFPSSTSELKLDSIPNPFEIRASDLTFELRNNGYRITHVPTGIEVNGSSVRSPNDEGR